MQWDHDNGMTPCSDFVDYVLEYALINAVNSRKQFDLQISSVTSTDKEYTLENLKNFTECGIQVTARRRVVKYSNTAQTLFLNLHQPGRLDIHFGSKLCVETVSFVAMLRWKVESLS